MFALLFSTCHSHDHSHQGGDSHSHDSISEEIGLEPLVYTIYTDRTELFVEFSPMTVGEESRFAAHFTRLGEQFSPFLEGEIELILDVEGKQTRIVATEPQVPGIFRLGLTPEQSGNARLTFNISTKDYKEQIIIEQLKVYRDLAAARVANPERTEVGEITYLKEQAWKVDFANVGLKRRPFHNVLKSSGELISAPGDEVILAAKSAGIVIFNGQPIVGSRISKGVGLFSISGSDMAAGNIDSEFQKARVALEKSRIDHERNEALYTEDIIALKEFEETKIIYDNAQIIFQTLARNHSKDGQRMKAPMTGFLKHVFVSEGEFVEAGTPLATISRNEKLVLRAEVSQRYYHLLPNIRAAHFTCPMNKILKSTDDLNGRVLSYGKSATEGSPFIPIHFEIDNRGELVPGSMVEVFLLSDTIADALVIPRTALMEQQGKVYVFVQITGESFDRVEVSLGADDGEFVQVLNGLNEGDLVVTKGAYYIKLANASGAIPAHGHEH